MMIAIYGPGVAIPLGLPWLRTKANFNCTCSWVGLELLSTKLGYTPQHASEHFDRGDQNISLATLEYFGSLVSSDVHASALLSSFFFLAAGTVVLMAKTSTVSRMVYGVP